MKKTIFLVFSLFLLLFLCSCECEHEWEDATCTSPETCSKCGEESGSPLGHRWRDATCTKPERCRRCGETKGEPLGHDWAPATCTGAATCKRCGEENGKPLGHKPGEWKITAEATITRSGQREKYCTVCGELLETSQYDLDVDCYFNNGVFLFDIREFCDLLDDNIKSLNNYLTTGVTSSSVFVTKSGRKIIECGVGEKIGDTGYFKPIALIHGINKETGITDGLDQKDICKLYTSIPTDNADYAAEIIIAIIMSSDPTISLQKAIEIVSDIAEDASAYEKGTYTWNGLIIELSNNPLDVTKVVLEISIVQ